ERARNSAVSRAVIEDGGDTNHPVWIQKLALLKTGTTRGEVEALLPRGFLTSPGFGSSGMHREFYTVSNTWQVAVIYESPDMRYLSNPNQALLDGPIITRVNSDTRTTYKDPHGSFVLKRVDR